MADDINLPNLISHLQVNLANTSGLVADATRQGSSVGAALGSSLQRELRDTVRNIPDIPINGDSSDLDRDLARVRRELDELSNQRIGVDISVEEALRRMAELEPHLDRLQHTHPNINVQASVGGALRQLAEVSAAARQVDDEDIDIDVDVDSDNARRQLDEVRRALGRVVGMIGGLAGLAAPFVTAGAAVGALVPLLGAVVTTLAQIAPAAATAVSGLIAVKLATSTIKLAMVGVEDAISAALDPEKAEEYAEALKKLSPNARLFVEEFRKARPVLDEIRKTVQDKVFAGLDKELRNTAKAALPSLRTALNDTSDSLNRMAKGVGAAARDLADRGILGTALKGATKGLKNLERVPGQVVTALGKIGAAAAPGFDRLTKAAAKAADELAEKIDRSFESGAMEKAIDRAIDLLGDLKDIAGNVAGIIANIFKPAQDNGGGLIGVLKTITGELEKAFADPRVQKGLGALYSVMNQLAKTVGPLLSEALKIVGDVFAEIGPDLETFIREIGPDLKDLLKELGPIAKDMAKATGELLVNLAPVVSKILQLVTLLVHEIGPAIEKVAPLISDTLGWALDALADLLNEFVIPALRTVKAILTGDFSEATRIAGEAARDMSVSAVINFQELRDKASEHIRTMRDNAVRYSLDMAASLVRLTAELVARIAMFLQELPGKARSALRGLASSMSQRAVEGANAFLSGISNGFRQVVSLTASMPGRVLSALGNLGSLLWNAGARLIGGFISGIQSQIGRLQNTLSSITNMIPDWKGPPEKDARLLTPAGRLVMQSFITGIDDTVGQLRARLLQITREMPGMLGAANLTVAAGALSTVPGRGQLTPAYTAPAAAAGHTFHLHQTDASPDGILRALSWRGLVGGTSG
ncbi:hypothetical protein ABZ070_10320 [Streptomyces sp. NPDC006283]|uniref:phage tail protein n=1 Tax=Streptomyces sp. NPDC006283 TaxID=3156741 RepID=UPI0033B4450B